MADYLSCPVSLGSLKTNEDGTMEISFTVKPMHQYQLRKAVQTIRQEDKPLAITVAKERKKRSLDANAYCWVLCHKLAEAVKLTKEEVYRDHIRAIGQFEPLPIREDAVERFAQVWGQKGTGWFVDVVDDSKLPGYKKVFAYYGSSTYDTAEMSLLIDNIVQDCKAVGIETLTPAELDAMKEAWKRAKREP